MGNSEHPKDSKYAAAGQKPRGRYTLLDKEEEERRGDEHGEDPARPRQDERTRPPRDQTGEERRKRLLAEWRRLSDQTWSAWLLMRYRLNDLGFRPIPAGEAHWRSPDIYIESSDPSGNGVAGQDNFVHARIFNLGKADAIPTRVDFYWADPSLGLGPSSMNLIGTEWVEVPRHRVVDVRCKRPWVPVFVNGGHECLMVNCSNAILDPIAAPFSPRVDRHVGQRNVTVLPGAPGQALRFQVNVLNLFDRAVQAVITARIEHVEVARGAFEKLPFRTVLDHVLEVGAPDINTGAELMSRYLPGTDAHHRVTQATSWLRRRKGTGGVLAGLVRGVREGDRPSRNQPCIGGEWDGHQCVSPHGDAGFGLALLEADKVLARRGQDHDMAVASAPLAAFEQRRLRLELGVPTSARPGEMIAYHIAQRAQGIIVGGYTVVVRVTGG